MKTTDLAGRWCILQTSPGRTLALARSLCVAGRDAWSPRSIIFRRRPRSNETNEIEVPIAPTFVFLRASQLVDVARLLGPGMVNPHPPFSVFRYDGRAPLIADRSLDGLREEEARMLDKAAETRQVLDEQRRRAEDKRARAVRKERRRAGRSAPRDLKIGAKVTIQESNWSGMSGVVISTDGKTAQVSFGGALRVTVDAWLLLSDELVNNSSRRQDRQSTRSTRVGASITTPPLGATAPNLETRPVILRPPCSPAK